MSTLLVDLISPERRLIQRAVSMVVLPGSEGDFAVLPGHAPLVASLRPGVVVFYDGDEPLERYFIAGGFADVAAEKCAVLAEQAVPVSALDADQARQELQRLEAQPLPEMGEPLALLVARARLAACVAAAA